jgi:hypothetical protein
MLAALYDSYVDLFEKNEVVFRETEDALEQNQKL